MHHVDVITHVVTKFAQRHECTLEEINDGWCDQCANEIVAALFEHGYINARPVASWLAPEYNPLLSNLNYWADHSSVNFLGSSAERRTNLLDCGHAWVELDGRHFDSEALSGVDNPLDLPFYKREIESIERKASKNLDTYVRLVARASTMLRAGWRT